MTAILVCIAVAVPTAPSADEVPPDIKLDWEDNILTVSSPQIPGSPLEIWYLEAFCRSGSTDRDWAETVIPQTTELVQRDESGQRLVLKSTVEPAVEAVHTITVDGDTVLFSVELTNNGAEYADVSWVQPCMRVGTFTGLGQDDYIQRCFIYVDDKPVMLDVLHRTQEARYKGGQVYVPPGIDLDDVNPRPISSVRPERGIIGCVSADGQQLLAMAWSNVQELFQGVIVCIHADFRVGGLAPGETKHLEGRVYVMENDPARLLDRYKRDFGQDGR